MRSFEDQPHKTEDRSSRDAYGDPVSERRYGRDMTIGSIPRHLVAFSVPMLAGSVLHTAYSFVNAIWVGRFVGTDALAAVTVSFPVVFAFVAVGLGLTMATGVLTAQHYGARDHTGLRRVVDNSTFLMLVLSGALTLVGEASVSHMLVWMDTPPIVLRCAIAYLRIFLLGLPLGFGLFLIRSMLQGIGDAATPLYFQSASVLLNTVLDPILIFGWLGFPRLGLTGAAWASVFAQAAALAAMLVYLRRKQIPVTPRCRSIQLHTPTLWAILRLGVPSAVQQALVSLCMVFVTGIVNHFGAAATAAFGAASRIDQIAFMPAMSFSMAITTLTGQNIGARSYERVKAVFRWGLR